MNLPSNDTSQHIGKSLPRNHDPSVIRSASVSITITWNSLDRLRWRIAIVSALLAARRWMRDLYCLGAVELVVLVVLYHGNSASPAIGTASVKVTPGSCGGLM